MSLTQTLHQDDTLGSTVSRLCIDRPQIYFCTSLHQSSLLQTQDRFNSETQCEGVQCELSLDLAHKPAILTGSPLTNC